ncbi:DNA mismatch repair protein MutS [Cyanobacterium sp. HL-69]|uniref:DNA mismatch repair protein MutS n=1 Tax=Cyanobacterium sp. HL-69 TaxID=2054282 RepID=UPI000CA2A1EF|nr:DNA mismatch repair protein MutS [Cyanobacterium sp. HL-69]
MTEIVTTKATRNAPHEDYRLINIKDLTPMYHHYVEVKEQYPNCLLLYRVGDFFECFFQDAVTIAQELELVITSKDAGQNVGRIAMTGVPHHALDRYARQLVEKGYGVVICDQVEDASKATAEKRLVKRAITKLLTPGTVTEDEMLPSRQNNFLAAVVVAKEHWGLAYADISTGEFFTTQSKDLTSLATELLRLQPAEILFPINAPDINSLLRPGQKSEHLPEFLPDCFCYTLRSQKTFDINEAKPKLLLEFKLKSLEGVGCEHLPLAIRAAGGLLDYVQDTQKANQVPLQLISTYSVADYLMLDATSRRNLEITTTVRDNTFHGSLLWALDKTCTAMGARALRRWLLQPLLSKRGIIARQDTIAELIDNLPLREEMRSLFKSIYDLERITGRVGASTANPKELLNLGDSLLKLTYLAELAKEGKSLYFQALQNVPPELEELGKEVVDSLVESPPQHVKEGGIIRDGVNKQLDEMRRLIDGDKEWLANLEVTERERTGINNLKVGYNKTFGYYISMPRSKAEFAPENYQRKQTLLNEERYITAELKEKENRILNAKDDLAKFEYQIFVDLRSTVAQKTDEIRKVARAIAAMDVLSGLAELAVYQDYNRPEITEDRTIKIKNGRHPVVEKILGFGMFVPNSTSLGAEKTPDLIVLTGPNASGKSCYLRQVGLIQLMTQIGSFIPAESAKISICDRIFTRVGAVDDIATGQSTFMVEMNETANILNHATDKSLVLLDEIGRGTATFDGLSIAWAVAEYLAIEIQSRTIFATHYHELNELASILDNVANYQVTVKELENEIIFLHEVKPGGADKSYGIEAGRLAGLPKVVISRAKQVMTQIEKHSKIAMGLRKNIKKLTPSNQDNTEEIMNQLDIFE